MGVRTGYGHSDMDMDFVRSSFRHFPREEGVSFTKHCSLMKNIDLFRKVEKLHYSHSE